MPSLAVSHSSSSLIYCLQQVSLPACTLGNSNSASSASSYLLHVATGSLDGSIALHSLQLLSKCQTSTSTPSLSLLPSPHKAAVRSITLTSPLLLQNTTSNNILFSASADKSLAAFNTTTAQLLFHLPKAHSDAINTMLSIPSFSLLATGSDDGVVKLWDTRSHKNTHIFSDAQDYISDMTNSPIHHPHTLITASADGHLSIYDLRKASSSSSSSTSTSTTTSSKNKALVAVSEKQDDELLSLAVCRRGTKLAVGDSSGLISLFSWGQWLDSTDRFPGHPDSVDTLAVNPLDDSELMTGSADGLVRQINILPNRFVGVVGAHDQGAGVEQVAFVQLGSAAGNGDDENQWALSCGGDCAINLWNLGQDEEEEEEEEEEEDDEDNIAEEVAAATSGSDHDDGDDDDTNNSSDGHNTETPAATTKTRKQKKSAEAGSSSAEDSSTSSNDDDDDDDSSDDDKPQRLSRKKKRQKLKTAALALSSNKQHAHKSFFSGLD